jgi:hypothetical protein
MDELTLLPPPRHLPPCDAAAALRLSATSTATANALRHALLKDVCVAAMDHVTLHVYDGPLEPELVAHRFGQLPVALLDTDNARRVLDSDGSGDDVVATFDVDVTNTGRELLWVTSHDLTCTRGRARIVHYRSAEEEDVARGVGFLVCALHPKQRLRATAAVKLGTARTHGTRWCAVFVSMVPTYLEDDHVSDEAEDAAPPTSYDFVIETTGAVSAYGAWRQAVTALATQLPAVGAEALAGPLRRGAAQ